jgi:membrane-associated phospholipid phosphatase
MTPVFKAWLASLVLTAAAVYASVVWLDRPLALWIRDTFGERHIPVELTDSTILSIPLIAALAFVICGVAALARRRFSKIETTVMICTISTLGAIAVKDQLKFVFGRTWPASWAPGIVSLLADNAYGFHYFHSGRSFESFPSGHATVAAAVLSIPWILYSELRVVCAAAIIAIDLGLVALNLHFLSDVIAGTFIGASAGLFTVALWRASGVGR